MITPDFVCMFGNFSTVWTIEAVSAAAKDFANAHFPVESWMGTPEKFTTDWRPARDIVQRLAEDEGFVVCRKMGENLFLWGRDSA